MKRLLLLSIFLPLLVSVMRLPVVVMEVATSTPKPTRTPTPTADLNAIPDPNQLVNGCFEGTHGAPPPAPWQMTAGWDVSRKPSNPCVGIEGNHAARINDPSQSGLSGPNRDERIWQVVAGQGPNLVAEMQCVHHYAYYTDMNIYGGDTDAGPWMLLWTPFTLADCAADRWGPNVKHAETLLPLAYPYYKVEFAAMYAAAGPASDQGGVKFTQAFFRSS